LKQRPIIEFTKMFREKKENKHGKRTTQSPIPDIRNKNMGG